MSRKMFLDGDLVEGESLELGVKDPGLSYGFGIFETIRFRVGKACFFREHFERLKRAAEGAEIQVDLNYEDLLAQTERLFEANAVKEGIFKIIVSERSEGARVAVFIRDLGFGEEPQPLSLRVSKVKKASAAFTTRHKTLNYMENLLELKGARTAGFDECLFTNESGSLTECCMSNFLFVSEGVLRVPSLDCGLLDGIVRAKILEIARRDGIPYEEGAYSLEQLETAEEAFVTNSGSGTVSITQIQNGDKKFVFEKREMADRLRNSIAALEEEAF